MSHKPLGIYVHIPFCVRKCNYCDFCSFPNISGEVRARYIDRLCKEISSYKRETRLTADTVFFGGGTPSLLSTDELSAILSAIRDTFILSPDTELTLEVNPGTVSADKLLALKNAGVNRISFGLQSIHENELKKLGRIHSYSDFLTAYSDARAAGFDNISVDLMYGIPEQTEISFKETLLAVLALAPEHLSVYGLIIEEGTPFYDGRSELELPTEDAECDMYISACATLAEHGYLHYEISNYASGDGYVSRHNLKYWRDEEYLGFGAAAYSYFEGRRFGNSRSIDEYITSSAPAECDILSVDDTAYEYAMLALRTSYGFSLYEYKERFGSDFMIGREALIKKYSDAGLLLTEDGRIRFTERGFYVSNSLLCELL